MKNRIRAVYRFLGSRRLATTLLLSWTILLVMWVVPFIFYGLPAEQINKIVTDELFFRFIYIAVLVTTAACITARIPALYSQATRKPTAASRPRLGGQPTTQLAGEWDAEAADKVLADAGLRYTVSGDGWAWGVKNRWAPWGNVLFHLALFFILGAAALGLRPDAAFVGKTVVVVGEKFESSGPGVYSDLITKKSVIPQLSFTVESFEPRFYSDLLLFTKLEGVLKDAAGKNHRVALGSPWLVNPTTMVSVEDFGYAVTAQMRRADGQQSDQTYKLKVFPSEMQDSFSLSGATTEYRVDVRVFGDYVARGDEPGNASFNRTNPRLLISVYQILSTGAAVPLLENKIVALGQPVDVGQDVIVLTDLPYYGVFRITRMTWAPLAFAGLILLFVGAVMRLGFSRREALLIDDGGVVSVTVRDQTYRGAPGLTQRIIDGWEMRR